MYNTVALRKESVDRNSWAARARVAQYWSLSARRAWIEIVGPWPCGPALIVALRKESVDRNIQPAYTFPGVVASLSARRAWIEISRPALQIRTCRSLSARRAWIEMRYFALNIRPLSVALRKESVDRNRNWCRYEYQTGCRSPQGERG